MNQFSQSQDLESQLEIVIQAHKEVNNVIDLFTHMGGRHSASHQVPIIESFVTTCYKSAPESVSKYLVDRAFQSNDNPDSDVFVGLFCFGMLLYLVEHGQLDTINSSHYLFADYERNFGDIENQKWMFNIIDQKDPEFKGTLGETLNSPDSLERERFPDYICSTLREWHKQIK